MIPTCLSGLSVVRWRRGALDDDGFHHADGRLELQSELILQSLRLPPYFVQRDVAIIGMDLVSLRNTDGQKKRREHHVSTRYVQRTAGRVQLAVIRSALEELGDSLGGNVTLFGYGTLASVSGRRRREGVPMTARKRWRDLLLILSNLL